MHGQHEKKKNTQTICFISALVDVACCNNCCRCACAKHVHVLALTDAALHYMPLAPILGEPPVKQTTLIENIKLHRVPTHLEHMGHTVHAQIGKGGFIYFKWKAGTVQGIRSFLNTGYIVLGDGHVSY